LHAAVIATGFALAFAAQPEIYVAEAPRAASSLRVGGVKFRKEKLALDLLLLFGVLAARRHRRHPIKIIAALSSHLPADENKFAQLEKMRKILLKILPHAYGGFVLGAHANSQSSVCFFLLSHPQQQLF
jgi:hypothetical protein